MTRVMQRVIYAILGICFFAATAPYAHAQTDFINSDLIKEHGLRNLENAVVLQASPANPNPGDIVRFTVESPLYDLTRGTIRWNINGKIVAEGVGVATVNATVSAKGDPINAIVTVTDSVWGIASDEILVVPLQLDILYDAPTYVPPFYRGRALPSAGGTMRLQAVAHFTQNGSRISDKAIVYTWSRNGTVLGSISGLGRSSITIGAPALFGTDTISVRATARDETISAVASVRLASTEPVLTLYEDHPLFGIMFHQALPSQLNQPGDVSLAAMPYFAPITSLRDANLQYRWTLDDVALVASSTKRNQISLGGEQNNATLRLNLTHAVNFFMQAAGSWKFIFTGSGGTTNTGNGTPDAFHNSEI
jgi:hypothetical protein